mgnify:CR=1 FL=1
MRIAMIGAGYVGLVSGACFSEFGFNVVCVDRDKDRIERLTGGDIPIFEPGLESLILKNTKSGRLSFTTSLSKALDDTDAVFIAVGTPSRRGDGHADLSFVYEVAREISGKITDYAVIVTKSTVPVGTGDEIERLIKEINSSIKCDVVSNPEFLREGSAIDDFMRPDRVVIGTSSEKAREIMRQIYRPLFLLETPILFTDRSTAELIKYAGNTFLATKITFINEISDLCEKVGANIQDVAKGIGLDGRIGPKFLHPGPGYGGSCFPKDTLALVNTAQAAGSPIRIVETVVDINNKRKQGLIARVKAIVKGKITGKQVAVLGVTFKPNTDDMRDSPSLDLIPELVKEGAVVNVYDPEGMENAKQVINDVHWCDNAYDALTGCEVGIILTEWNEFRALDLDRVKGVMKVPLIVDLRNIYEMDEMSTAGFEYHCLGVKSF